MSVPQNANEVVQHLLELSRQLEKVTNELNDADMKAVNKREDAKMAESRAFLGAEGTIESRKHTAIVESHTERLEAETAEAIVRGLQRSVRTLQTRIDVGRTYGATLRSELAVLGSGVLP